MEETELPAIKNSFSKGVILAAWKANFRGTLEHFLPSNSKHEGEPTTYEEYHKMTYATQQIVWIIKKGEVVESEAGIRHAFRHKIFLHCTKDAQLTTIYMSTLPAHQLPSSVKKGGSTRVCQIEFDLDPADMNLKNRHWYNFGPKYYRAEYQVRALTGAGLKLQVWGVWGRYGLKSKDGEDIQVSWQEVAGQQASSSAFRHGDGGSMYRY